MTKTLYYIANIRLPTEKAHGIQIMRMCEAFAKNGAKVALLVPKRKNPITLDPFDYYSIPKGTFTITRLPCLDLTYFGWIGFWLESLTFADSASWYALFHHGMFYTRDSVIALYLQLLGKHVVWEVHTKQTNLVARMAFGMRVRLVAITAGLKNFYTKRGVKSDRILVAHDAVDPRMFQNVPSKEMLRETFQIPNDAFVLSYIGKYSTMGQSKGVEHIVDPFIELHKKYPRAFMLVVGPNPAEVWELETVFAQKNITKDSYNIVSHVPYSEVPRYIKVSDALLMVYPDTEHYAHFMSPLKLFEYMASGVPIVTSDLPSVREVLDENTAYFFSLRDSQGLFNSLLHIYENKEESLTVSRRAQEKVKEYSWKKRAQHIINFIYAK